MSNLRPGEIWEFPWPMPRSHYDTDGPTDGQPAIAHLAGASYVVTPTGDSGAHSGRDRFHVECVTCKEVLHANTTGPSSRIRRHQREAHDG